MLTREEFQALYEQGPDVLFALVGTLMEANTTLELRVKQLEDRLGKDSHNSSKPPPPTATTNLTPSRNAPGVVGLPAARKATLERPWRSRRTLTLSSYIGPRFVRVAAPLWLMSSPPQQSAVRFSICRRSP